MDNDYATTYGTTTDPNPYEFDSQEDEDHEYLGREEDDYSQQVNEEANFHFTLSAFQDLVKQYGVKDVLKALDKETEEILYWHYTNLFPQETPDPVFHF
jgi:hypothetical protein